MILIKNAYIKTMETEEIPCGCILLGDEGKIEKIGVNKSLNQIDKADIVLFVLDGSQQFALEDKKIYDRIKNKKHIVVVNKIDKKVMANSIIITSARHSASLKQAYNAINNAIHNINNVSLDLIAIDLNDAFASLGEITGTSSNEVVLDSIFSKFCLGK